MTTRKLKEGERYLSIALLGGQIKVAAFKNKDKAKPEQPDYVGNGVAVWVNAKQAEQQKPEVEDVL